MAVAVRSRRRPPPDHRAHSKQDAAAWLGLSSRTLLAALVLLGAAIRFSTLGEQSFWYDEATTHAIVAQGLGHVLSAVPQTESTPPLYYMWLWLWAQLFGHGEVGLRSFSALCGTLTIPVLWAIGRRLFCERAGLIAALLTAVNPFLFWYSQEARSYSLLLLLSALSLLALVRALELPGLGRVLAWGLVSAVALGAHYFAAFVLVPEAVWLLISLLRSGQLTAARVALGCGPILLVAGSLVPLAAHQNDGRAGYIATMGGSIPHRLAQLVKQDIIGDGQPHKVLLGLLGAALVVVALVLLLRRGSRNERVGAPLPAAIGCGGVLLAIIVAAGGRDYINTRNMLATWPAFALLTAAGLGVRRAGRVGGLIAALLSVLCVYCVSNVIRDPALQRDDWRGAAHALGPLTGPRAIVADRYTGLVSLQAYLGGVGDYPAGAPPVREIDVIWLGRGTFGNPIILVKPLALPGFELREIRTSSYIVVQYRASRPAPEAAGALLALYPQSTNATALLQQP
ncbi:MAG: glycosyltransferase family 39 protein [Actinomycetota bacterium]|nr:glycosyltransferase family 39 protein [Actinomycetota bacterium]